MTRENATATAQKPVQLSDEKALDEFVSRGGAVLVEFHTNGCGICKQVEPVLGIVARQTEAAIGTINPRDDPPLIERFDVQSVPLFVIFVDGEPVDRRAEGFVGADELLSWIESHA